MAAGSVVVLVLRKCCCVGVRRAPLLPDKRRDDGVSGDDGRPEEDDGDEADADVGLELPAVCDARMLLIMLLVHSSALDMRA